MGGEGFAHGITLAQLKPDHALAYLYVAFTASIFENKPFIQCLLWAGRDIFNTILLGWDAVQAPNAKQ